MGHIFAQEVDRQYDASQEGAIIKIEWVKAAIDAHNKLDIDVSGGGRVGGLDIADGGVDKNAWAERRGILLTHADEWTDRDPGVTARRAVTLCPGESIEVQYDCIGIGSAVKSEINRIKDVVIEHRDAGTLDDLPQDIRSFTIGTKFVPWDAGASPLNKNDHLDDDPEMPTNGKFFANIKAQGWYMLARRFYKTWMMVEGLGDYPHDELICIDKDLPFLRTLEKELCQPVMIRSTSTFKQMVDKQPQGTASPNIGDSVMMCYWPVIEPDFKWYVG